LREKEAKIILANFLSTYKLNSKLFGDRPKVEIAESNDVRLFFVNDVPHIFEVGNSLYPTLLSGELLRKLPVVAVDLGAIPHLCNGADVMAPGIRKIEGSFSKGSLVLVVDERYGKPIAVGLAEIRSDEASGMKKGKAVRNVHFVGDRIWQAVRGK